jgi:hypothetical protein
MRMQLNAMDAHVETACLLLKAICIRSSPSEIITLVSAFTAATPHLWTGTCGFRSFGDTDHVHAYEGAWGGRISRAARLARGEWTPDTIRELWLLKPIQPPRWWRLHADSDEQWPAGADRWREHELGESADYTLRDFLREFELHSTVVDEFVRSSGQQLPAEWITALLIEQAVRTFESTNYPSYSDDDIENECLVEILAHLGARTAAAAHNIRVVELLMRWALAEDETRFEEETENGYWRESGDGMPPLPCYEATNAFLNAWSLAANFPAGWEATDLEQLMAALKRRPPNMIQPAPTPDTSDNEGEDYSAGWRERERARDSRCIARARSRKAKEVVSRRVTATTPCIMKWMLRLAAPLAAEHPVLHTITTMARAVVED